MNTPFKQRDMIRHHNTMLKSLKTLSAVSLFILIICSRNVSGATLPVDLMVTNALVVTMDAGMTVIENGSVVIEKAEIVAVGPTAVIKERYSAARSIDAAGKLVMPGLIIVDLNSPQLCLRVLLVPVAA